MLQDSFQLQVNRSTICRAVDRVARRGEATWHARQDAARRSIVNGMDEIGWNVAAQLRSLWVAVSEEVNFCDILPSRGIPQAAAILGAGSRTPSFSEPAIRAASLICCAAAKT